MVDFHMPGHTYIHMCINIGDTCSTETPITLLKNINTKYTVIFKGLSISKTLRGSDFVV